MKVSMVLSDTDVREALAAKALELVPDDVMDLHGPGVDLTVYAVGLDENDEEVTLDLSDPADWKLSVEIKADSDEVEEEYEEEEEWE